MDYSQRQRRRNGEEKFVKFVKFCNLCYCFLSQEKFTEEAEEEVE
jgi:hypothetical protein